MLSKIKLFLSRVIGNSDKGPALSVISPKKGYELWATSYGKDMNPVQQLEAQALEELLPPLKGGVVLDLGCGKGRISRLALERGAKTTIGLDFTWRMVQAAYSETHSASAHYLVGSAPELPFKRETFDVVVCALLMGHLKKLDDVLAQIYEVLRPGGFLLISDFHPYESLRGSVRSFRDVKSNRSFVIEQHVHLFEDYQKNFNKLGFILEDLREPLYKDFPLVFVLRARKPSKY